MAFTESVQTRNTDPARTRGTDSCQARGGAVVSVTAQDPVPARIEALREKMRRLHVSACIIPTGDPHMSEYVSDHYKSREFITGFTGSAGTAVITLTDAGLWTDSRYWLQAADELDGSGITLFRDGAPGTADIAAWLCEQLPDDSVVGVNGLFLSAFQAEELGRRLAAGGLFLHTDPAPAESIWADRPDLIHGEIADHPLAYAGISRADKIGVIRNVLNQAAADALVLSGLDDIAWLLNLRGSDIPCNPVFYSYVILTAEELRLYTSKASLCESLMQKLAEDGIRVFEYEQFFSDLDQMQDMRIMLDKKQCSDRILRSLPGTSEILNRPCPVRGRKYIKNPVEMDGIRSAHLRDGVALCKFLCWLKKTVQGNVGTAEARIPQGINNSDPVVTELSAADKLNEFRAQQKLFKGNSFDPIVAYGAHGAIVHYSADESSNVPLRPEGLVLLDTGGQYLDGTTDVTRTVVLGPLTDREKECFTAVLQGHIALASARFPAGLTGANLDVLAHQPLWDMGLDYGHGTGHGVGAYLNVHEDPIRISWRARTPALTEGVLTSDEPGYYEAGAFGIRHENLLLCVKDEVKDKANDEVNDHGDLSADDGKDPADHGSFLKFEPVTLAPFDLEGIVPERMQPDEIDWLNKYHKRVYESIAPFLEEDERVWLAEATRAI